jgi:hypothetical protein
MLMTESVSFLNFWKLLNISLQEGQRIENGKGAEGKRLIFLKNKDTKLLDVSFGNGSMDP